MKTFSQICPEWSKFINSFKKGKIDDKEYTRDMFMNLRFDLSLCVVGEAHKTSVYDCYRCDHLSMDFANVITIEYRKEGRGWLKWKYDFDYDKLETVKNNFVEHWNKKHVKRGHI